MKKNGFPALMSPSQKVGSFKKDQEILSSLIAEAPNPREQRRLQRLQCEHAGAWVTAVPSTLDGKDTVMRPAISKLLRSFAWVSQFWLKKSVVLCASMFLATMPHAARRMLILFTATTASATCWERSAPKEHCLQFLRRRECIQPV